MENSTTETIGCDLGDRMSDVCVMDAAGGAGRIRPEVRMRQMAANERSVNSPRVSAAQCQPILTGLRVVAVPHVGNQNESEEEVAEVRRLFGELIGRGWWTNAEGRRAKLGLDDVLVISPYNAQVITTESLVSRYTAH